MTVRAFIFDFNGTLLDDIELAYGSVVEIFKTYNLQPPTLEQYREEITANFMGFYYKYGFIKNFSGGGAEGDRDALNEIRRNYYSNHGNDGKIRDDAVGTVSSLVAMDMEVGIVSAEILSSLMDRLGSCGLAGLFPKQFIRAEVWGDKSLALTEICGSLGVDPNQAAYVDDTVDGNDAAKRAGLIAVGFCNKTGYNSEDRIRAVADFTVNELSELPELVRRINQRRM